ncbi:MAG TPA: hypothetical protein VF638_03700 [Sphingomonas sp.]|jgi:hypothetical protein
MQVFTTGEIVVEMRYRLTLSLAVSDATALWAAAAALAMNLPYMTMDDVIETIGPIDAPQIEDCLALLMQPERFGGCDVDALDITAATAEHRPAVAATPSGATGNGVEARRERFAFETHQALPAQRAIDLDPQGTSPMRPVAAATGSMLDLR